MNNPISPAPEIFISYHRQDEVAAQTFAQDMKSRNVRVWFDKWNLRPGTNFLEAIEEVLRQVPAVAVLVGPSGLGPWEQIESQIALIESQKRAIHIIPVLLPGVVEKPELPLFLQRYTWLDLRHGRNLEALAEIIRPGGRPQDYSVLSRPFNLREVLLEARQRLIISGHTLDKFTHDLSLRAALMDLLERGVKLSVIQLCPSSLYAAAHQPYHEFESTSPAREQHAKTLEFFSSVFENMRQKSSSNLEVVFSNYMPRFRTVIADDIVFLYLYMYGMDVEGVPDLILRPSQERDVDVLRQRVIESTLKLLTAPEIVPYIRCGHLFDHWRESKLAQWSSWSKEERLRHRLTHEFYVTYATQFHGMVGHLLEREVSAHLDNLCGTTLVLGCGSGKEVSYIATTRPQDDTLGVDFSQVAVELAKVEHPGLADRFLLGDFYDLDHVPPGRFQAIVANASFVHLYRRADIDEMLQKVWKKLEDGGLLFLRALYKEKNGTAVLQEIDSQQLRLPRWFIYFSRSELAERSRNIGFEVLDDVTEKIARSIFGAGRQALQDIREKGFRHIMYEGVFWPTLLLRKPELAARNS